MRTQVDRVTGQLSDTRTRFLGTRPPKLFAANVKGQRSMLSLSSRPWLGYSDMGRYNLTPLSYEALDYASGTSKMSALHWIGFLFIKRSSQSFAHAGRASRTRKQCHIHFLWQHMSPQLSGCVLLHLQALLLSSVQRASWQLPRTRCAF